MDLPPVKGNKLARLRVELRLVSERHREDAAQEAWVAYLEGKNPALAVHRYRMQERRHEEREIPFSQVPRDELERALATE